MDKYVTFIAIYLLGGLTFVPFVVLVLCLHAYFTFPVRPPQRNSSIDRFHDAQDDGKNIKSKASATSLAEKFHRRHEPDVAAGYFAVCREYTPGGINGKPPERTTPAGAVIATESPSVYQSMYRSLFDRRQSPSLDPTKGNGKNVKRARNVFFVVLRHGHLMLYEDSEQLEVKHVISLELHDVSIHGGGDVIPEGELWIKRNAIRLTRKASVEDPTSTSKPFFLFSENCSEKEDFYFALLQNQDTRSETAENPPRPQQYETKHIINLVQKLHSSEEHLQTRWINGLVGRLFLALYKTRMTEDFVRQKVTKKIARVKKPAFLSGIILQKIVMGESAPRITNPRLKDLTIDGDCCAEADLEYNGNFRLEIAATARIDLGARFKVREVNLVLAVVVKKLNGHVLVKFKPPPSNRIWITFETMPDMEMSIEPIVSSRQITYGIILRAIESRIREVMAETIVFPHWDDSPFTDTISQKFRGGIWADSESSTQVTSQHTKIPDEVPEDESELGLEPHAVPNVSPRTQDDKTTSMPVLVDEQSPINPNPTSVSSHNTIESSEDGVSSGLQKRNEPPKALRSRSFASAANPLLSVDNANVESIQTNQKRKQQQDATSAMMAISSRSPPTSPPETPNRPTLETPTLWQNSRSLSSTLSNDPEIRKREETGTRKGHASDRSPRASLPSTPTSTSSRSMKSTLGPDHARSMGSHSDTGGHSLPEKRYSTTALGAATVAARNWGWGVFNRNGTPKGQRDAFQESANAVSSQPMGRGRPLPPPGQPLPFPEGVRSKTAQATAPKRKPIAQPKRPQRLQENGRARSETPPLLPARKRQDQASQENAGDEGLLVVEAPPSSGPPSPEKESHDGIKIYVEGEAEGQSKITSGGGGEGDATSEQQALLEEREDEKHTGLATDGEQSETLPLSKSPKER